MGHRLSRWYAGVFGGFLLLQGTSTLIARLVPAVDRSFPALLETTRMIPVHSTLHIATGLLGLAALRSGDAACRHFSVGFGAFYLALGLAGWASGRDLCLGLQTFDHPFHLLLGALGLAAFGADRLRAA